MTADILYPEGTPALGATTSVVALTLATPGAVSVATDLTTANSLNISCFNYTVVAPTSETPKGSAPRRQCDTTQREQFGPTTYPGPQLQYTYDPQADDTVDANKAKAMLDEGLVIWDIQRDGKPAKLEDLIAGDRVSLHHLRLGPQNRTRTGDDEFAEFSITQETVYVEDPIYDVVIGA